MFRGHLVRQRSVDCPPGEVRAESGSAPATEPAKARDSVCPPHKSRRFRETAFFAVFAVVALLGCSPGTGSTPSVPPCVDKSHGAVVVGISVHQAGPPSGLPAQAQCAVREAVERGLPTALITVEGAPRVGQQPITYPLSNVNDTLRADDVKRAMAQFAKTARSLRASSDGNDFAAAVTMAADLGASAVAPGQKVLIIILDSGLSDRGPVNMASPGMSTANPDEVTAFATKHGLLPKLNGVTITAVGLGYGTAPQKPLPPSQRNNVVAIWKTYLQAAGATVSVIPSPPVGDGPTTSYSIGLVEPIDIPKMTLDRPIRLDDSGPLGFLPDSTDYRDRAAASNLLRRLAAELIRHPGTKVTVTGTTSNGETRWPSHRALGKARAEKVAQDLRSLSPRTSIETKGAGYLARPPVKDAATAAQNRSIILTFEPASNG